MNVEVRTVLLHEGRLVVHREFSHHGEHSSLPGGRVNARETAETALEREIREELGLEVVPKQLLYVFEVVSRIELHDLELVFLAEPKDAASRQRLALLETVDLREEAQVLPPIVTVIADDLAAGWRANPRWLGNLWQSSAPDPVDMDASGGRSKASGN
jgi:ADP-ribose pyrophosphatase YjhB (NUDIX family)